MDFAATAFPAGSFDVVWNIESMCHAFDKDQYLRHVFDLLVPGGHFVCLDMFGRDGQENAAAARAMCENWSLPSVPSVGRVRGWLGEIGFVNIESEDVTERVRRPVAALHAMALNTKQMLRIEQAVMRSASAVYRSHVDGAIACAEGVAQGVLEYAYVGARRP
jgi:SAM-dependent methyltransferase